MGTKPTDERGKETVEGWRQRRPRDIAINEFYVLKMSLRSIALQDCALTMTMVKVSFLLLCQSPQGNCHERKNGLFWRRHGWSPCLGPVVALQPRGRGGLSGLWQLGNKESWRSSILSGVQAQ